MKTTSIILSIFGLFCIIFAVILWQIPTPKDDDIIFYLFALFFSAFGGGYFLLAGIKDYNKSNQNKRQQ